MPVGASDQRRFLAFQLLPATSRASVLPLTHAAVYILAMTIRTIFTMAEACAGGERRGWQEFARDYVPLARALLAHYFYTLRPELDEHVAGVFRRARAGGNTWFRDLRFTNEREFLMAFRELAFAHARPLARLPAPEISLQDARELTRELSVVQRELFWLCVKGYGTSQVPDILMNVEATAAAVRQLALDRLAQMVPGGRPEGPVTALLEAAEKARTSECLSLKTFNDLINGQIGWQERDRAETHIGECVHCLDRFTSFQEMIWYRRKARPLSEAEAGVVLKNLGFSPGKGLVSRLFSKSA